MRIPANSVCMLLYFYFFCVRSYLVGVRSFDVTSDKCNIVEILHRNESLNCIFINL